jgi:hypothetical protein
MKGRDVAYQRNGIAIVERKGWYGEVELGHCGKEMAFIERQIESEGKVEAKTFKLETRCWSGDEAIAARYNPGSHE